MDMKSEFLILLFLSFSVFQSHAIEKINEKDTLTVYLIESDSTLSVDLIIENTYDDSVLILTVFKNLFFETCLNGFGIRMITYLNKKQFILRDYPEPLIMEKHLNLSNEKFCFIPPKEKVIFHINLEYYFDLISKNDEIGVEIYLRFCYAKRKEPDSLPIEMEVTTNYVKINRH
jgi:hypothetical protein